MTTHRPAVAVVGAGPRGTAVLERLLAHLAHLAHPGQGEQRTDGTPPAVRTDVHVVEPYQPGAGRVWAPDQPAGLLMNTLAAHATAFPDDTVRMEGPAGSGPSLMDWARDNAPSLRPYDHPSRALMGRYLAWAYERIVAGAPAGARVVRHPVRAIGLAPLPDGRLRLELDGGGPPLDVDAVVLATGHTGSLPTDEGRGLGAFAARHGLVHLPPGQPHEAELDLLEAGEPVVVRGLAMNFFDQLTLLTSGRGGRFVPYEDAEAPRPRERTGGAAIPPPRERTGGAAVPRPQESTGSAADAPGPGRLRYLPSGREPLLLVGSGRGVPYLARGQAPGALPAGHRLRVFDEAAVARLTAREAGTVGFMAEVWPLIAKEAGTAWYRVLMREDPEVSALPAEEFHLRYAHTAYGSEEEARLLEEAFADPGDRFELLDLDRPLAGRQFTGRGALDAWMRERLREDLAQARAPEHSPLKAAAAAVAAVKGNVRRVVAAAVLAGSSQRDVRWFRAFGAHVASGPPASRIAELLALSEAGVVSFLGARPVVTEDAERGAFTVHSPTLPQQPTRARALLDAWLPGPDVARTGDPLLRSLLDTGLARAHRAGAPGAGTATGAVDVELPGLRVRDAAGHPSKRLFAFGIPVEGVEWNTAIGARARSNASLFRQADLLARQALDAASANAGEADARDGEADSGAGEADSGDDSGAPSRRAAAR